MHSDQKVPPQEKDFLELVKETFNELKDPRAWFEYSKKAVKEIAGIAPSAPALPFLPLKTDWALLIIALAILFVLLVIFGLI